MTYEKQVMDRIRNTRLEMGLAEEAVDSLAGLRPGSMRRLESGELHLYVNDLAAIARALGRDVRSLLPGQRLRVVGEVRS